MTTRRRTSGSRRGSRGANRPKYLWHADATAILTIAPGASGRFDMLEQMRGASAERHQRRGMTAVRCIYDLSLRVITGNTDGFGSFMITPASVDAEVAGALPDPEEGEQDAAWIWQPFHERDEVDQVVHHYRGDLRTARKILGIDYTLEFILDVAAASPSSVTAIFAFRVLMRLP